MPVPSVEPTFLVALFVTSLVSGATASVVGFGIGSLLTPLMVMRMSVPLAVAAVAVPHALATLLRAYRLRRMINWPIMRTFGSLSALGGLTGAILFTRFSSRALTLTLGALLLATAIAALSDWTSRWRPRGVASGALGFASGLFGGLAGNQGGLRAAALLTYSLAPAAFVATSTAVGVVVDSARLPVYLLRAGPELLALWAPISVASAGVLVGTLLGERILLGLSPARFRKILGVLIGLLGLWLIARTG